ncbi:sugar transporter [Erythrobacteraceae bacterium CFH 75059]|uniref:MFS transporter n=1 Tax=Qipengyuania thermophila TaxID=2509361 RepID=UPI0010206C65|nr:MFS transporter [Qipengyuania thermophila]TCD06250.1 sugar transporter [Erythrobacteraceae bacterium CFH 75059]
MEQAVRDEELAGTPRRGAAPASAAQPLPLRIKLANGFGAVAFGVKDNGFAVFLLLYYNQVLGMPAATVSLALMLALFIDACIDPLLGNLSDRTYTSWGRRLPWMYAAAVPLGIMWSVLWAFPGEEPSFWRLLAVAVTVRLLLSMVEVPSAALVPELTRDYDERTDLFRWRGLLGWAGGLLMLLLAYGVFLSGGMLDPDGYAAFGIFGGALITVSVLGSALAQHRRVAGYPAHRHAPFSFRGAFSEIREAFSERAFVILAAGSVAAYVSQGITFALINYLYLYVWQFTPGAFNILPFVLFASIVAVFLTVGPLHRRWGKAVTASRIVLLGVACWLTPYTLFLLGFWPEPGGVASTVLIFGFLLVANWASVVVLLSGSSMVAEIVEAFEERTGRRAEGSFYAGNWFIQKCAGGIGIFAAGLIVAFAGLPEGAVPGAVDGAVIDRLILVFAAVSLVLAVVTSFWLARFPINRADHEARLAALAAAGHNPGASTPGVP